MHHQTLGRPQPTDIVVLSSSSHPNLSRPNVQGPLRIYPRGTCLLLLTSRHEENSQPERLGPFYVRAYGIISWHHTAITSVHIWVAGGVFCCSNWLLQRINFQSRVYPRIPLSCFTVSRLSVVCTNQHLMGRDLVALSYLFHFLVPIQVYLDSLWLIIWSSNPAP